MEDAPILICFDGSGGARRAIEVAASLFPGRRAVVLNVGPLLEIAESYAEVGGAPAEVNALITDQAAKLAAAGAALGREAGLRAEPLADVDSPTWHGIVTAADSVDAAVIVVGSRGLTGLREFMEGSVSHGVAEHAGRPVLVVPPPR